MAFGERGGVREPVSPAMSHAIRRTLRVPLITAFAVYVFAGKGPLGGRLPSG